MKKIVFLMFLFIGSCFDIMAQLDMLVTLKNGKTTKFKIENIKEMSFIDAVPFDIKGEWLNYDASDGTYEVWNLKDDGLMLYTYCFLNLDPNVEELIGRYTYENDKLTLNVSGSKIPISISISSETMVSATLLGSSFNCYKLTEEAEVVAGETITIGEEGDEIIYADNNIVSNDNGKIKGWRTGLGYALLKKQNSQVIVAYKIHVSPSSEIVDVTQIFNFSKEKIIEKFGTPQREYSEEMWILYHAFPVVLYTTVLFNQEGLVKSVSITFSGFDEMTSYLNMLNSKYYKNNDQSSNTEEFYYDTINPNDASVEAVIRYKNNRIDWYMLK